MKYPVKNYLYLFLTCMLIVFTVIPISGYSQKNRAKPKYIPFKYNVPYENINLLPVANRDYLSGSIWIVYSQQNNNQTYKKPDNKSKKYKKADFLQKFYVIDETKEWLHIVYDELFSLTKKKFSRNFEDFGWIRKDKLLLWDRSLMSDTISKIPLLCTIVYNYEKIDVNDKVFNGINFYMDPELKTKSCISSPLLKSYYIYKSTAKAYLLGSTIFLNNKQYKKNILGWVNRNDVLTWNNRLAYEPSYKHDNKTVSIVYADNNNVNSNYSIIWKNNINERKSGDWIRFKYIKPQNNFKQVKIIGYINNSSRNPNNTNNKNGYGLSFTKQNNALIFLNYNTKISKQLNIAIVIDITNANNNYINIIKQQITKFIDAINKNSNNYDFIVQFGLISYKNLKQGFQLIKQIPFDDEGEIKIKSYIENEILTGKNRYGDPAKSMYSAFYQALHRLNINKKSLNAIVFLTNETENNEKDHNKNFSIITKRNVENFMVKFNCSFTGCIISEKKPLRANKYINEINNLMLDINKKTYFKLTLKQKTNRKPKLSLQYNNKYFIENALLDASLFFFNESKIKSNNDLMCVITNSILDIKKRYDFNIRNLRFKLKEDTKCDPYIISHSKYWNKEITEQLKDNCLYFARTGFILEKTTSTNIKLFNKVFLMSKSELIELQSKLNDFLKLSRHDSDKRNSLKRIWKDLLESVKINNDYDLVNWGKIISLLYNIPQTEYDGILYSYTYNDIDTKISTVEINRFFNDLETKVSKLNDILEKEGIFYKYSFFISNNRYYWIDLNMLP